MTKVLPQKPEDIKPGDFIAYTHPGGMRYVRVESTRVINPELGQFSVAGKRCRKDGSPSTRKNWLPGAYFFDWVRLEHIVRWKPAR